MVVQILSSRSWLLLLTSAPVASFSFDSENACLIQASRSSIKAHIRRSHRHHHDVSKSWRTKHRKLERTMNASQDLLQKFIASQEDSSDACSARLLEAKRVLDGLLHDVRTLSAEVVSHETLLVTVTENLNITHLAIDSAEETYDQEKTECQLEQDKAREDLSQYEAELRELLQIADPDARYEQVTKVIVTPHPSLITMDQSTWNHERCLLFVDFARRSTQDPNGIVKSVTEIHRINGSIQGPNVTVTNVSELSCDLQRKELQEAFNEAYVTVTKLIEDAKERSEDKSCFEAANAKHSSAIVPLVSEREQATTLIEQSTQALVSSRPVLEFVRHRAEKLQAHIDLALKPECSKASEVSKALQDVRNLIMSLEECPGRHDFQLVIPASGSATAAAEDLCPAENCFCPKGMFACASGPGVGGCFAEPNSKKFPGCHSFATRKCSDPIPARSYDQNGHVIHLPYDHLCPVDNEGCSPADFKCTAGPAIGGCFNKPDSICYPGCQAFAIKAC